MTGPWCGTISGHNNHGCKCEPCKVAWRTYCRDYRKRLKAVGRCVECSAEAAPYARCDKHRLAHNARMRLRASRRKLAA